VHPTAPSRHQAVLLPGAVLPAAIAYAALVEALGERADARPKELELYREDAPPPGYRLELEGDAVLREADAAGFDRFHLVGYSGGGSAALALVATRPERVLSLALLEPAWVGWSGLSDEERALWAEQDRIRGLPPDELMPRFVRLSLRPGVEPPQPPEGPRPPWMAQRPAGIAALTRAFRAEDVDHEALRRFERPVYLQLGALSAPAAYEHAIRRLERIFPDATVEVFEDRHHFAPPHRLEPERLAASLLDLWKRAEARTGA
jgi:pimeloyl-ACP methyl ester carboxylesterase